MIATCGHCNDNLPKTIDGDTCPDCGMSDDLVPVEEEEMPRTCSICDAIGHGYPGGGGCPLESLGWEEALRDEWEGR